MKILKNIISFILNIFNSDCEKCGTKNSVSFYYEDHFHSKKNIYKCNQCGEEFIGL